MPWWRADAPIRSDRCFRFDEAPDLLWQRLSDVSQYRTWWPWLREFDGVEVVAGASWRCRVQPPAPYAVRFTLTLDEVEAPERIAATVAGDISGTADLHLRGDGQGTEIRLVSVLVPRHRALRALAVLGRPLIRLGHDWVLDSGARQFERRVVQGGQRRSR